MIELDIQTLEKVEFGRTLLAKLRFTRILQMQMLLNLEHSRPTMKSHIDYNVLKQRHVVFVKKLEEFAVARPFYGINGKLDKVLQCSNVLLRTIEMP
ncbi:hypothetical protein BEWA_030360 [Theileria equi strain WA]|uniref:Uncharacterized protein n=1 Tax=Theileria equi strain WA TaxID=1537102 RepID=L0AY43_THEEQ|nr:hypothetical protein BEWA_030360 [Theileria equi strain WA]AFZ80183.1 hypothetical protein BEWA_030360 [Theileria equi strain WA]|eukprot:XP_004829849.1 hypothetical protein BEWA_030360 [Theileria equi strain WA]